MGKGAFFGNALDLYVTVEDPVVDSEALSQTLRSFANRFYEATDGQVYIRDVWWTDDGWGLNVSDVWLRSIDGDGVVGIASPDGLGVLGARMEVNSFSTVEAVRDRLGQIFVHELGHYLWGLGDEYAGPALAGDLDVAAQQAWDNGQGNAYERVYLAPDFPLGNPVTATDYDLTDSEVRLRWGEGQDVVVETRFAQSVALANTGGLVLTVNQPAFGLAPSTASHVSVRPFGRCGGPDEGFCVMNGSGGDPALREFCGSGNHDPQDLTAQSHRFAGASCWETIAQRMGTQGIVVTAPSVGTVDTGVPPDAESIGLRGLAKERRMVLVLDRSGSMAESNKAEGARLAVTVWLQSHATTVPVLPERLGVITYNSEPATLVPLQALTQQQATAFEDEIHEALEPGGATNIRDALDDAADMLIDLAASPQGGGRAVYQGVVLVSDGVHNTPPPSTEALSVIPRFKENGIPIFTLALGSSSDVDLTTLEELARQTGGRAFVSAIDAAAGTDQSTKVAGDIIIMNQQFRGTAAVYEELDFDALPAGLPLSAKLAVWASHGSRPKELSEIFEVAGVGSISQLMQAHPGRARLIGCLVEEGAERLEVLALFPPKHDTWLYLVDPIGRALPPNEIKAIRGPGAFDGAIVEQPIAGQWVAILIRVAHGPRFAAIASVGIENRRLAVAGGCDHWVAAGVPARLWARATFGDELSGLVVRARLRGPDGQPHDVVLSDARPDEPFSGIYEGFFTAPSPGLYTGRITISNKGGAKIANGFDRSFHSRIDPRKGGKLDLSSGVGPFSRTLRVYCEVGARSKPKDRDVALDMTGKNAQPTQVKR